ncbi:40S ribosomal protein S2 [Biomphalaria glabrata]
MTLSVSYCFTITFRDTEFLKDIRISLFDRFNNHQWRTQQQHQPVIAQGVDSVVALENEAVDVAGDGKIKSLEEIYLFSLPIKECEIIDFFLVPGTLKDEVLKIMPVQKQTRAGQRTRFKAFVAVGDYNGHVGLGVKCSKEVATAIRGAIILAKLSVIPVRRGYWGNKIGKPHTVPCKVTGKCGSVLVRLIPAPRGTGIVSAPVPKKLLTMAGIEDCYTSASGATSTLGNFAKATYSAIAKTYSYLTPDLWKETVFTKAPYQEFTDYLMKNHSRTAVQRQEQKVY